MMSLMSGMLTVVLSPMPPLGPGILAMMHLTRSFAHFDTWRIIAAPIPRNNFEV